MRMFLLPGGLRRMRGRGFSGLCTQLCEYPNGCNQRKATPACMPVHSTVVCISLAAHFLTVQSCAQRKLLHRVQGSAQVLPRPRHSAILWANGPRPATKQFLQILWNSMHGLGRVRDEKIA